MVLLRVLLNDPTFIEVDSLGNLYFSDKYNHRIRKVSAVPDLSLMWQDKVWSMVNAFTPTVSRMGYCHQYADLRGLLLIQQGTFTTVTPVLLGGLNFLMLMWRYKLVLQGMSQTHIHLQPSHLSPFFLLSIFIDAPNLTCYLSYSGQGWQEEVKVEQENRINN